MQIRYPNILRFIHTKKNNLLLLSNLLHKKQSKR